MRRLIFSSGSLLVLALVLLAGCATPKPVPQPQPVTGYNGQTNQDVLPKLIYRTP